MSQNKESMKEVIPLFPHNIVVFPGQELTLRISEKRYINLVQDCWQSNATFGIQPVIKNQVQNTGTEVSIIKLDDRYSQDQVDVTIKGKRIYRLLTQRSSIQNETYSNGVVAFVSNNTGHSRNGQEKLMACLRQFEELLVKSYVGSRDMKNVESAYDLVHKVGLSLKKQYALLANPSDTGRKTILLNHCRQQFAIEQQISSLSDKLVDN